MMEETYNSGSRGPADGKRASGSFWAELKNFDLYQKVDEEFRVQTTFGASFSIAAWVVIAVLLIAELKSYMSPQLKEHLVVDTSLGQQLTVNFNVTFHALTCAEAHLDAMDIAGDNQLNLEHDMVKQRVSSSGELIGIPGIEIVGEIEASEPLPEDYCGSCYGANVVGMPCCNTCDDLKRAYEIMGWSDHGILQNSTQCLHDAKNPFAHVKKGEGCRLTGTLRVNKVSGNFHVAFGDSIVRDGMHIHQFLPQDAPGFNVSHTVHSLSFGEPYPDMLMNPLDQVVRIVKHGESTGLYQYFIKVVPTVYTSEFGFKHLTNQYTVSERFRPFSLNGGPGQLVVPGIFFIYDMSAFVVEVQKARKPLLHMLTRLCAIIGGVFSIIGVVDKVVFRLDRMLSKNK